MERGRPKNSKHPILAPFPTGVSIIHQDGTKPWLPQVDEPVLDYYRFKFYLDMGVERTLSRVASEMRVGIVTIKHIAKDREWDRRVMSYEKHLLEIEFEGRDSTASADGADWEKRRSAIREGAFLLSNKLLSKAEKMLDFPLETITESEVEQEGEEGGTQIIKTTVRMPAKWTFRDAAAIIQTANQLQRLAADMSTSNTAITVQQRKVDLTVQLVLDMTSKGKTIDEAKQKLLDVGIEEQDLELAIQKIGTEVKNV
jgi:hypothetical protein